MLKAVAEPNVSGNQRIKVSMNAEIGELIDLSGVISQIDRMT